MSEGYSKSNLSIRNIINEFLYHSVSRKKLVFGHIFVHKKRSFFDGHVDIFFDNKKSETNLSETNLSMTESQYSRSQYSNSQYSNSQYSRSDRTRSDRSESRTRSEYSDDYSQSTIK